jgi:hypothetical protein
MVNQTFFMVYVENGSTPTYKHETLGSAEEEAKRLSKKSGQKAFVLCTLKSFQISEFTINDCRPSTEELPF